MAIGEDLRHLILILEEEGFGAIAGEILTEISLGREVETDISHNTDKAAEQSESTIIRLPIEKADQITAAMAILRLRLVSPIRAFAEAERLAGRMAEGQSTRIRFIDPVEYQEIDAISHREAGDQRVADELDQLLTRLPGLIEPDPKAD